MMTQPLADPCNEYNKTLQGEQAQLRWPHLDDPFALVQHRLQQLPYVAVEAARPVEAALEVGEDLSRDQVLDRLGQRGRGAARECLRALPWTARLRRAPPFDAESSLPSLARQPLLAL